MATAATRAKDSDRNDTCQILDTALADGQLNQAAVDAAVQRNVDAKGGVHC